MSLLSELTTEFGLGRTDLMRIIQTAPARYKSYPIDKRRGGTRIIAQPSRELKLIQYYLIESILSKIPVHTAAVGYVKGLGIEDNARIHAKSRVIIKLDFEDFFPSLTPRDFGLAARGRLSEFIDAADIPTFQKLLFWSGEKRSTVPRRLSIGAPTSPMMSNILMYEIDEKLADVAREAGVVYTRYADDITVSGRDVDAVLRFEATTRRIVSKSRSPNLRFNEEKRGIFTRGQRRMVTGLVITPEAQVSIGRARKREISALLHRSSLGQLSVKQRSYLKGMLGFCIATEPTFLGRMRAKYGDDAVDGALKYFAPPRDRIDL